MDLTEILTQAALVIVPVLVAAVAYLWRKLGKVVAESDNKIDDAVYKALNGALAAEKNEKAE